MATLFYEPSTRTRLSFESAMWRLGGRVISTENAREFSSAAKGETLEDTIRVISGYADVIVLRHFEQGAAVRAATVSRIPIINAGDGPGQHPTQALLDFYTIQQELHRTDNFTIAFVGDLAHGRTVHSLAYLLTKLKQIRMIFVAPKQVAIGTDIKTYLNQHQVDYSETENLESILSQVDVIYQTRIQRERFHDPAEFEAINGRYTIDNRTLSLMSLNAVIMHPLPRVNEINPEVDTDLRAAYFRQAENGLYVRMALLHELLSM